MQFVLNDDFNREIISNSRRSHVPYFDPSQLGLESDTPTSDRLLSDTFDSVKVGAEPGETDESK